MNLQTMIEHFITAKRADGRAKRTLQDYNRVLSDFADWYTGDPNELDRHTIRLYVAGLRERGWADSTVAIYIRNLRSFFRWCYAEDYLAHDLATAIHAPRRSMRDDPPPSRQDIRRLLAACDNGERWAVRDVALVYCAIDTGMRRGELHRLTLDDVHDDKRGIWITIYGQKTGKYRYGILGDEATNAMREYLKQRVDEYRALWIGDQGPLSYDGIYQIIKRHAREAGLPHLRPHDLRKYFATRWIDRGGDQQRLMRLGGWSSPEMLEVYVRLSGLDDLRRAHRKFSPGDDLGMR
jgi:site-specific recombinase XerD